MANHVMAGLVPAIHVFFQGSSYPSPFPPCDLRSFARKIAAESPLPQGRG